jgi:hypothetical protein
MSNTCAFLEIDGIAGPSSPIRVDNRTCIVFLQGICPCNGAMMPHADHRRSHQHGDRKVRMLELERIAEARPETISVYIIRQLSLQDEVGATKRSLQRYGFPP